MARRRREHGRVIIGDAKNGTQIRLWSHQKPSEFQLSFLVAESLAGSVLLEYSSSTHLSMEGWKDLYSSYLFLHANIDKFPRLLHNRTFWKRISLCTSTRAIILLVQQLWKSTASSSSLVAVAQWWLVMSSWMTHDETRKQDRTHLLVQWLYENTEYYVVPVYIARQNKLLGKASKNQQGGNKGESSIHFTQKLH